MNSWTILLEHITTTQARTLMKNVSCWRSGCGINKCRLCRTVVQSNFPAKNSSAQKTICRHLSKKSFAFMRKQSKFNFRCAKKLFWLNFNSRKWNLYWIRTYYFKSVITKYRLNCFALNKISELLTYEHIYQTRILITLFIDWRTYCLSSGQLTSVDCGE